MKFAEFKNNLAEGKISCIYLFEGEDAYYYESGFRLLKDKLLGEPSLNLAEFDGEALDENQLFASLRAYPFLSERRFTAVKEFYPKTETVKKLVEFFSVPQSGTVLVIRNVKPCEALKKISGCCAVDCSRADVATTGRLIKNECAERGVTIDMQTASSLARFCLCDTMRALSEADKLCAYTRDVGVITEADVDELVGKDIEYKIYNLTDYVAKKKFDDAVYLINDMTRRGDSPQRILSAVYGYFRKLLHIAISDMPEKDLRACLGISSDYAFGKMKTAASAFKKRSLKSAVDTLTEADFKIKSGVATPDAAMWLSVFKIMTD